MEFVYVNLPALCLIRRECLMLAIFNTIVVVIAECSYLGSSEQEDREPSKSQCCP